MELYRIIRNTIRYFDESLVNNTDLYFLTFSFLMSPVTFRKGNEYTKRDTIKTNLLNRKSYEICKIIEPGQISLANFGERLRIQN
jgi:hypothetical protein